MRMSQGIWQEWIPKFMFMQDITPHRVMGHSPAELLTGHSLRSPLDRLHPDFGTPEPSGSFNWPKTFLPVDWVYARHYAGDVVWVPTVVVHISSPQSYHVALKDSRLWCCHINQLRCQVRDQHPWEEAPTVGSKKLQQPSDIGPWQPE